MKKGIFITIVLLFSLFNGCKQQVQTYSDKIEIGIGTLKAVQVGVINPENLFDLSNEKSDYPEYNASNHFSNWNKKLYTTKLKNIRRLIKEMQSDILFIHEVDSKEVIDALNKSLKYKYVKLSIDNGGAIQTAVLSHYKIKEVSNLIPYEKARPIFKVTLDIEGNPVIFYASHWKSKRHKESTRILYAEAIIKDIKSLPLESDYVILGDLNSNYNEAETMKSFHNDTSGKTGINHVLKSVTSKAGVKPLTFVDVDTLLSKRGYHCNLWLEKKEDERWSDIYGGKKSSFMNILMPKSMYDQKGIDYVKGSFTPLKPCYLLSCDEDSLNDWRVIRQTIKENNRTFRVYTHVPGFTDHLPLVFKLKINRE